MTNKVLFKKKTTLEDLNLLAKKKKKRHSFNREIPKLAAKKTLCIFRFTQPKPLVDTQLNKQPKSSRIFHRYQTTVLVGCVTHQHVLGQPALVFGNAGGDAERETLLAQQGVSSVATAEGENLPCVRQVGDQDLLRVAGPRVDQRCWRADRRMERRAGRRPRRKLVSDS